MFRVVPFRKLSDICNCKSDLSDVYKDMLRSNKILIQDTIDMVIEEYTLDELFDIVQIFGVDIQGITFSKVYYHAFKVIVNKLSIKKCKFLNDKLRIRINPERARVDNVDDFSWFTHRYVHCLEVRYLRKVMRVSCKTYWSNDRSMSVLCFNESPFLVVNDRVLEINAYFDLVQVCKTNLGFEFVIVLPSVPIYLGIRVDNDLNLLSFENLDNFRGMCLAIDGSFKDTKLFLARHKILNDWSDILA